MALVVVAYGAAIKGKFKSVFYINRRKKRSRTVFDIGIYNTATFSQISVRFEKNTVVLSL